MSKQKKSLPSRFIEGIFVGFGIGVGVVGMQLVLALAALTAQGLFFLFGVWYGSKWIRKTTITT